MGRLHKHMYMRLFRTNDGIHLGSSFKAFTFPQKIKLLHTMGFFLFASPINRKPGHTGE